MKIYFQRGKWKKTSNKGRKIVWLSKRKGRGISQ